MAKTPCLGVVYRVGRFTSRTNAIPLNYLDITPELDRVYLDIVVVVFGPLSIANHLSNTTDVPESKSGSCQLSSFTSRTRYEPFTPS